MPFSALTRKAEMIRAGLQPYEVADACGVNRPLVSHIVAGRRWGHPAAERVMRHIADRLGVPVEEVFPGFSGPQPDEQSEAIAGEDGRRRAGAHRS